MMDEEEREEIHDFFKETEEFSFDEARVEFRNSEIANIKSFMDAIMRARPAASKGTYLKKISVTSSMGPGLKIDKASVV